jgi:hypothetical protein
MLRVVSAPPFGIRLRNVLPCTRVSPAVFASAPLRATLRFALGLDRTTLRLTKLEKSYTKEIQRKAYRIIVGLVGNPFIGIAVLMILHELRLSMNQAI